MLVYQPLVLLKQWTYHRPESLVNVRIGSKIAITDNKFRLEGIIYRATNHNASPSVSFVFYNTGTCIRITFVTSPKHSASTTSIKDIES